MNATEPDTLWALARRNRDAGIAAASAHSGDEWHARAVTFVWRYLRRHAELFVDDLWAAGLERPASPRALGAVMKECERNDWMSHQRAGGGVVARPSSASNGQLKAVWQSHIYQP